LISRQLKTSVKISHLVPNIDSFVFIRDVYCSFIQEGGGALDGSDSAIDLSELLAAVVTSRDTDAHMTVNGLSLNTYDGAAPSIASADDIRALSANCNCEPCNERRSVELKRKTLGHAKCNAIVGGWWGRAGRVGACGA